MFQEYLSQLQLHYSELQQQYNVYEECLQPILTQTWESIWLILLFSLLLRLFSLIRPPPFLIHCLSVCLGCCLLFKFFGYDIIYVLLPCIFLFPLMHFHKKGLLVMLFAAVYLVLWYVMVISPWKVKFLMLKYFYTFFFSLVNFIFLILFSGTK